MLRAEESLKSVFAVSGYDQTGYELGTALLEALTNPKCWKRWKKKKKAFSYGRNCSRRWRERNCLKCNIAVFFLTTYGGLGAGAAGSMTGGGLYLLNVARKLA